MSIYLLISKPIFRTLPKQSDFDITDYLKYVLKNLEQMQAAPENFTPFVVALKLQTPTTKTK
jgi:hypothetical protein